MMNSNTVAIVGATGAVGRELLSILEDRLFPIGELRLLASNRSAGSTLPFRDEPIPVRELSKNSFDGVDLAFFSAGSAISKEFVPIAVKHGTTVIDNSSAFRMDEGVPLVVPEVNGEVLDEITEPAVIANPNCSTIIALVAVTPLHRAVCIKRMVISTYQAASGAGAAAMNELKQQATDFSANKPLKTDIFGRQYLFNLFSHDSPIDSDGYNYEEAKMALETQKIWSDETIAVAATCIRVPVLRAHSESINLTLKKPLSDIGARQILNGAPGVTVVDDREKNQFPEPINATGQNDVLVGRIRTDTSQPLGMGLNLFVSGDQLRKGAALNAIQIAELLIKRTVPV